MGGAAQGGVNSNKSPEGRAASDAGQGDEVLMAASEELEPQWDDRQQDAEKRRDIESGPKLMSREASR